MCVADESWALDPPSWASPPNPASTALWRKVRARSGGVVPRNTTTIQGIYCMTADGDFLSGAFATARHDVALAVLQRGWQRFEELAESRSYAMKPVPDDKLGHQRGRRVATGGLKLEVAARDLPRGSVLHPGRSEWQRKAFNLNWLDLSAAEAAKLVTESEEPVRVHDAVLQKIALQTLKDNVRGQSNAWQPAALREGQLFAKCVSNEDGVLTVELTGKVVLRGRTNAYSPKLHGRAVFDSNKRRFLAFDLLAMGQRQGRTQFNFRQDDTAPAPLGVALTMAN